MNDNSEVISRLKFISKLKKGEKINTRHLYVQADGWSTSFSRTFLYQDNRGNALSLVQQTIARSFELLELFESSNATDSQVHYQLLNKDLRQATIGLVNLKCTYIKDTKFCCDMDTLLEDIHARLSRFVINIPPVDE
uniref:Uncharacterized protein n=1 Tax=viral metagenome TaxID=1070528 RepID=A0A6C0LWW5_9ZZZZ